MFLPFASFSQICSIKATEHLEATRKETYKWLINGQELIPNSEFQVVKINFPKLDTIIFFNNHHSRSKTDTVITRLTSDNKYVFTISCCNDNYKIYNEKTYFFILDKYEDIYNDSLPQSYKDSIFSEYKDRFGNLKIEVINIPKTDSLIVFPDFEMYAYGHVLDSEYNLTNEKLEIGDFTNRHYDILFVQYDNKVNWRKFDERKLETEDDQFYKKLTIIKELNIRVFNDETALLIFNYKTKNIQIKFYVNK